MSDTEVESVHTMASLSYEEVVENIQDCAKECAKSGDFISFSTMLDIYLHDWQAYSVDERLGLMELLTNLLNVHKKLLAEIGWDLPPLLLSFLDCEWPVRFGLRESRQIVALYKIFNLLAEYGSSKELLLTCAEEIKNIQDPEINNCDESQINELATTIEDEYKQKFENDPDYFNEKVKYYLDCRPTSIVLIKFHVLFECMRCCIERIKTIYPSKFLGIIVSSVLNFMNNAPEISAKISVLRTLYLFIRDYNPPEIPEENFKNEKDSVKDLEKVFEDECYLQGKLIRFLFDSLVEKFTHSYDEILVSKILPTLAKDTYNETDNKYWELADRLIALSLSLDINAAEGLVREIETNDQVFSQNKDKLKTVEDIIRLSITSYNNSSFRKKNPTELPISNTSLIFLYTYSKYTENVDITLPHSISVIKLIEFQLKILTPFTVNPKLTNLTVVEYLMIITVLQIENNKLIATVEEFGDLKTKLLILTYLQNLAAVISNSNSTGKVISKLYQNFLKKFLQHLPEDLSYEYIIDTLKSCPFEENIVLVLSVYKNLVLAQKFDDERLTKELAKVKISNTEEIDTRHSDKDADNNSSAAVSIDDSKDKRAQPPALPERSNIKNFISFTELRQNDFLEVFEACVLETFAVSEQSKKLELDLLKANKLLNFLCFIDHVNFENHNKVVSVLERLKNYISIFSNDRSDYDQKVSIFLELTLISVNNCIKKNS